MKQYRTYNGFLVSDLNKSTLFYEGLGFEKVKEYSNENSVCLKVSESIFIVLLKKDFFQSLFKERIVGFGNKELSMTTCLSVETKHEVDEMLHKAKSLNAKVLSQKTVPGMYTLAFEDLDGHVWEFVWMDVELLMAHAPK